MDANDSDKEEMREKLLDNPGLVKVTYPCADRTLMEYINPVLTAQ